MEKDMCTIKLVNNKWRCYSHDGKELCAYTVKAWAVMFAEFHGLKIIEQNSTSLQASSSGID